MTARPMPGLSDSRGQSPRARVLCSLGAPNLAPLRVRRLLQRVIDRARRERGGWLLPAVQRWCYPPARRLRPILKPAAVPIPPAPKPEHKEDGSGTVEVQQQAPLPPPAPSTQQTRLRWGKVWEIKNPVQGSPQKSTASGSRQAPVPPAPQPTPVKKEADAARSATLAVVDIPHRVISHPRYTPTHSTLVATDWHGVLDAPQQGGRVICDDNATKVVPCTLR